MTTAVYDHKNQLMAVDCRIVTDGVIDSDNTTVKFYEDKTGIWMFSGVVADYEKFRLIYTSDRVEGVQEILSCYALFYDRESKAVYFRSIDKDGVARSCKLDYNYAIGSGSHFALAFLDMGKNAVEAIAYTCKRDLYTGPRIMLVNLTENTSKQMKIYVDSVCVG